MKPTKSFFAAFSLLILVSCAGEKTSVTDDMPIAIHPSIKTRATETAFETGDKIGVTIKLDGVLDSNPAYKENAELIYNGEHFESTDIKWFAADNKGTFEAYYPFEPSYNGNIEIVEDQTGNGYSNSDILMALATNVTPNVNGVSLNFVHAMSQLIIKVYNNTDYDITDVILGETQGEAVLNIQNMSATVRKSSDLIEINTQQLPDNFFRAVIAPQNVAAEITIKLDGTEKVSKILPKTDFKSGIAYKVNMTITDDFDITDVDIKSQGDIGEWVDGGLISD